MEYLISIGVPLLIIVVGITVGYIFKRFIHHRLSNLVTKTKWKGDDIVLQAIEALMVPWFLLLSLYLAGHRINIVEPYNGYFNQFILVVLILTITFAISNFLIGSLNYWSARQKTRFPSTKIFTNLIKIIVLSIGVLIALDFLGVSITPMLTALGVGGLAISLALKDTLSDLFSGLHILLSQKVKPGDFIQLDSGERGYITNISWRNTTMLERANNVISIPNSRISAAIVKNFDTNDSTFSVRIPVGVDYRSDLDHVEKVTQEIANAVQKEEEGGVSDVEPLVRFFEFADSSINLKVYFRARRYGDHHAIKHEFVKRLHKRFNDEGINIPFPIRTIIHENNPDTDTPDNG
jgi:small-conductance mechanosensitive channel